MSGGREEGGDSSATVVTVTASHILSLFRFIFISLEQAFEYFSTRFECSNMLHASAQTLQWLNGQCITSVCEGASPPGAGRICGPPHQSSGLSVAALLV